MPLASTIRTHDSCVCQPRTGLLSSVLIAFGAIHLYGARAKRSSGPTARPCVLPPPRSRSLPMKRYLLSTLGVAIVLASASSAHAFFGMGECGCAAEPSCGCEMACEPSWCQPSCCDPCARKCIFGRLRDRMAARRACCSPCCEPACGCAEPSCGCAAEPSCGCAAEPSCGCEASCCDSCNHCCSPCKRGCIFARIRARRMARACCAPACGCEASCGCEAAPSCGCGM